MEVDEWCGADLFFFSLVIPVYSRRTRLVDPDKKPDSWAVKSYTDAAGGSVQSCGRGVGMTMFPNVWTYVPWGRRINEGWVAYDGKILAHKKSTWEFLEASGGLCGQCWKGWAIVCDFYNTLFVALHQVSSALCYK